MRGRTAATSAAVATTGLALVAEPAAAHVGGLSGVVDPGPLPLWLLVATGGVLVGASFLFATFLTDHAAIRAITAWGVYIRVPASGRRAAARALRLAGVGVLGYVAVVGLLGPRAPIANAAILVVWAGWWAGFTMAVYLVGNPWPAANPWRTVAALVRSRPLRPYPARLGAWPSVVGLLALVWLEVTSPLAEDPTLLVAVIAAYTVVTVLGAAAFGRGPWFANVDPVSRVFRVYGRLAPLQRTDGGVELVLPTAGLNRQPAVDRPGETAFVVALLWVTTYDGLVSTPAWRTVVEPFVAAGVPARLVYVAAIVAGFLLFVWAYRAAAERSRGTASTYVSAGFIRCWFVPSLVPIAAGYHLAHFLGYFLSLLPVAAAVAAAPLAPPHVEPLAMPDWFSSVQLLFVLGGHLLAIWVAHARSFELFPGVLAPIRSQYPFIAVMVFYTMTSMWVVAQPFVQPPYV